MFFVFQVQAQLPDGGILYTETDMTKAIPEPLNTLSSCLFLALAIYWFVKLIKERNHRFLLICTLVLFTGSVGGTLYHGLRRYHIFLFMDYMPIMILCLMAGVYFLSRVMTRWYYSLGVVILYFLLITALRSSFAAANRHLFININYSMLALMVLGPTLLLLTRINWQEAKWVGYALASFLIAITFRIVDPLRLLPTGTHFLWHIFGAAATSCMFIFIYRTDTLSARPVSQASPQSP